MKFRINKKYVYIGLTAFLVVAAGICFYYLLFHGTNISNAFRKIVSIAMPVIDGLILAYLLTPVLNGLEGKVLLPLCRRGKLQINQKTRKWVRFVSVFLTMLIVVWAVYSFFMMVIPQLIKSIQSIIVQLPIYLENLAVWLEKLLADNPDIEKTVMGLLDKYSVELNSFLNNSVIPQMNELIKTVSLSLLGLLQTAWNFIIGFIISIYVLGSKEVFAGQAKKLAYAVFETRTANQVISNFRFTHRTFSGFISGKIIDSIIIGLLCFAGTSLMGTPYAILVSVIVGVTNVIPFFGPYFGAVPSALLILMIDPRQCLYFIIFIVILQQFDGNILGPKILGNSTGLTSFWVLFAITIFGGLFGVLGMIVGVPVFAVLYASVRAWAGRSLRDKEMPTETAPYLKVESVEEEDSSWKFVYSEATMEKNREEEAEKKARAQEKASKGAGKGRWGSRGGRQ